MVSINCTSFFSHIRLKIKAFCKICNSIYDIQWNLSIADMLYSGHISITDSFLRNQLSPVMVTLLYIEPLYSEHLSIADTFFENQWCPLLRGFTV